jgi:hypothetical protein
MGIDIEFPQGRVPDDAAGWARSFRKAPVKPSAGSVTPIELSSLTTDLIDNTASSAASQAVAEHVAATDPHAQYTMQTDVDAAAGAAQAGAIAASSASLAAHEAAVDPHPVYVTQTEGDSRYQQSSAKNAASGYAGLNASSRITKGADAQDDLVIDLASKGLVLKDTQGTPHYWRVTISNAGALVITDVGTTKP